MKRWIDRRRSAARVRNEAGDTLVEILISITIVGIAFGAILTGLTTAIMSSSTYRALATVDTVLRTAASEAASEIQQNAAGAFTCSPLTGFTEYTPTFTDPALPSGFQAQVATSYYTAATGASDTCTSFVKNDETWALLDTITVSEPSKGATDKATIIVDNPAARLVPTDTSASQLLFAPPPGPPLPGAQQIGPQQAGVSFTVVVTLDDSLTPPEVVPNDFSTVTLSSSPAGALSGCSGTEIAGAVTFSNCVIDAVGTYTLTATDQSESITSATSNSFDVGAGPPAALLFTGQLPDLSSVTAAKPFGPAVTVEDAFGNVVTADSSTVTLAITPGTGVTKAVLSGCTESESLGIVSFSGCSINKSSTTLLYTLTATDIDQSSTLTSPPSNSFYVVTGSPYQLAFTTSPTGGTGGSPFPTQAAVAVEDAGGNIVTNDTSAITLSLSATLSTPPAQPIPSGAALSGCAAGTPSQGVTTFSGCSVNDTADGYTLTASDTDNGNGLVGATSSPFNVTLTATQLLFTGKPSTSATAGEMFSAQPQVSIEDAAGNVVTSNTSKVTLAITPTTGTIGCTSNPLAASSGVASFADCEITTAGTYTITATDGSLASAQSSIDVTAGTASQLAFTTEPPGTVTAGTTFAPVVTIEDAYGNVVSTNSTVTLAIGTNPGGGTLGCAANSVTASGGVATFSGCKITAAGTSYTLTATDGTMPIATSTIFNVVASPATQLAFVVQPGSSTGGVAFNPQPAVAIEDAYGNPVTTDASTVTLAIAAGSIGGGTLSSNCSQSNESNGVAEFSSCSINKPGTYKLTATENSLTAATSTTVTVTVGPAANVLFTTEPPSSPTIAGAKFSPTVTLQDAGGNIVTNTYQVTLSITQGTGTSGAGVTCAANKVNTSAGVATFSNCAVDTAGTNYTLTASVQVGSATAVGTSTAFTITPGSATQLVFTTPPSNTNSGAAFNPQPVVAVEDMYGNVATSTATVTLSINSGNGTLACTPVAAVNGVATFAGCSVSSRFGGTFTLKATANGLSVVSGNFQVKG